MKVDFKKTLDSYQAKQGEFKIVELPARQYLMVDGRGDPNTSKEFSDTFGLLYPVAYTLKFMSKKLLDKDYVVPPPEGLWWADDMSVYSDTQDKSKWFWTVILYVPDWIDQKMFNEAIKSVAAKNDPPKNLDKVHLGTLDEGLSVQTLFVGPYAKEGPVIEKMHKEFMPQHGLKPTGKHHEIYMSDFRRVAPDKLRTIIRQPVKK